MHYFGAYMAKYYDRWEHQSSCLSAMREGARALYNKVQAVSRVPKLEKELEKAQLEWTKLLKERAA